MSRQTDLESLIRDSYTLIREYEAILQTSDRPAERLRTWRDMQAQRGLLEGYLREYRTVVTTLSDEIAAIAAHITAPPPEPSNLDTLISPSVGRAATVIAGDYVQGDKVLGDKVLGDKITVGNISPGAIVAIGRGTTINITRGLDELPTRYDARVRNFLEYYLGTPDQPAPFGGRQADLDRLDAWLADPQSPPYALLTAPAGRGKSALLARWVTWLEAREDSTHPYIVYWPVSIRFNTNLEGVTFAALAARLAHLYDEPVGNARDADTYRGMFSDYLRRSPPGGRPVLVVLDGLDEAAGWAVGADLFPLIPPSHLRVLVAARPLAGDADECAWLARLGWEAPDRAQALPLAWLDLAGVRDVLAQMGNPLDALAPRMDVVGRLYELSEGDPLLVRLYVEALLPQGEQAAQISPENLEGLKPGLDAYMDRWFEEQRKQWGASDPLAKKPVRGLLNLCATALGPLLREDVLELGSDLIEDGFSVDRAARAVGRFVIGDGLSSGYVFSHPRLRDYFLDRLFKGERRRWRDRFLAYGHQTLYALEAGSMLPGDASAYVVQHYGVHLEEAQSPDDDVYALIREGWLRAWEWLEGTEAGFLTDVACAWRRAEEAGATALGQQIRAALCLASAASVSTGISADLLAACVRSRVIGAAQALVLARRKPDPGDIAETMTALAPHLPEGEREAVLGEALAAARAIENEGNRADALSALAPYLPEAMLGEALAAARAVGDERARARALSALASHLPEALLGEALAVARAIRNESAHARALSALVSHLPEAMLGEVLAAICAIRDACNCALDLSVLMPHLPEAMLGKALAITRAIGNEFPRADALSALAPHLPEAMLGKALVRIHPIWFEAACGEALDTLALHLPQGERERVLSRALAAARAIEGEYSRANALSALAPYLPEGEREAVLGEVLAAICAIRDAGDYALRLSALAPHLPEAMLGKALLGKALIPDRAFGNVFSRTFGNEYSRARALSALASHLPEGERGTVLGEALATARVIEDGGNRADALSALASRLPEGEREAVLGEALAAARAIWDEGNRADALSALAPRLPEGEREAVLGEALATARAVGDERARADALSALAPHLPEGERETVLGDA
ncbi:MAG: ATP-binding protein, partial [Anaerolineae bacterium]|nr:ATP-binding protein [Anaerolineae bacterium]